MKKSILIFRSFNARGLLLLYFLFTAFHFAQAKDKNQGELDSLMNLLRTAPEDTGKVNALNEISKVLVSRDDSLAITNAEQAIALAQKLRYNRGLAKGYVNLGDYYELETHADHLAEALKNYRLALSSLDENTDKNLVAHIYLYISAAYFYRMTNYAEALNYSLKALKLFEETGDKFYLTKCIGLCGMIYASQGNNAEAEKNLTRCITFYEDLKDSVSFAYVNNVLAGLFVGENKLNEGLQKANIALDIYTKLGNRGPAYGVAWTYSYIALIYKGQGEAAFSEGDKALAIKKFNDALQIFELRLKIEQDGKMRSQDSYIQLADWHIRMHQLKLSNDPAKELTLAKDYLAKGLQNSISAKELGNMVDAYQVQSVLDSLLGNFHDAYDHFKLFTFYHDSVFNEKNAMKSTQLRLQFEFDKKQAEENAVQQLKDTQQRNIRNSIIAVLIGSIIFLGIVFRQRNKIEKARKRSDELLLNILPAETAAELKATGATTAKDFSEVTVMFTDFKDFTAMSEKLSAQELVNEINYCFSAFDNIISKYGIEKIKTVGDSYMCAGGLPVVNQTNAEDIVRAALDIRDFMLNEKESRSAAGKTFFEIRIGVHTGPVVAGIVGIKKFAYDIWGNTVNIASRMESSGEAGKVNISRETYELVKGKFSCECRGKIQAKNLGEIDMYFINRSLDEG